MSTTDRKTGAPAELPFQIYAQQLEKLPPCQARCPNSGDVRGWLGIIAQRDKNGLSFDEACDPAWRRLVEFNPLPATIGRICPHPCEDLCSRKDKDGAVSINAVERFLGDWGLTRKLSLPEVPTERFPESVGVVGSGPASLSFAYQMAALGYSVTMYDRDERPGGMLRHAIPDYRLPREVLDAEVDRILGLGVWFAGNVNVGVDVSLEALRDQHELVFLGLGAQAARRMGIPGEDGPGVLSGIDFLRRRKARADTGCGGNVLVIGGGNTAIDAARSARRDGSQVTLIYRRSESEMPAAAHEVEDARREGVEFRFLAAPTRIVREGGEIRQVEVQGMRLGEPDTDGRRRPEPIAGKLDCLAADTLIVAISQEPGWATADAVLEAGSWLQPADDGRLRAGLYAGGDDLGPGIASRAIGQGRHAAESAHAELRGRRRPSVQPACPPLASGSVRIDYYADRQRADAPRRPEDDWLANPDAEVDLTLNSEQVIDEAARCMSCGLCFDCQQCFMYCNRRGFTRIEETRPGKYFAFAFDACEGCGKCIELCPCGYIEAREELS
jgi:NADPH-dependent glutamate synthase beta subunit-like oxidoreductase/Pyruvate/2-oxoacid:ferredoxin oxidoreductase delta subunit